jgi:hypothetical protein
MDVRITTYRIEPKRYVTGRVHYLRLMLREYGAAFQEYR